MELIETTNHNSKYVAFLDFAWGRVYSDECDDKEEALKTLKENLRYKKEALENRIADLQQGFDSIEPTEIVPPVNLDHTFNGQVVAAEIDFYEHLQYDFPIDMNTTCFIARKLPKVVEVSEFAWRLCTEVSGVEVAYQPRSKTWCSVHLIRDFDSSCDLPKETARRWLRTMLMPGSPRREFLENLKPCED